MYLRKRYVYSLHLKNNKYHDLIIEQEINRRKGKNNIANFRYLNDIIKVKCDIHRKTGYSWQNVEGGVKHHRKRRTHSYKRNSKTYTVLVNCKYKDYIQF